MTKPELFKLRIEIEKAITRLDMLQTKHRAETGQKYTMPGYLVLPDYLKEVKREGGGIR